MRLFSRGASIAAGDVAERLARREVVVLDVRESAEWKAGHIRGARHLPLARVASGAAGLARGQTIVTVCRSGHRSSSAARALRQAGFEVLNLDGGMRAWARQGLPLDPPRGRVV